MLTGSFRGGAPQHHKQHLLIIRLAVSVCLLILQPILPPVCLMVALLRSTAGWCAPASFLCYSWGAIHAGTVDLSVSDPVCFDSHHPDRCSMAMELLWKQGVKLPGLSHQQSRLSISVPAGADVLLQTSLWWCTFVVVMCSAPISGLRLTTCPQHEHLQDPLPSKSHRHSAQET